MWSYIKETRGKCRTKPMDLPADLLPDTWLLSVGVHDSSGSALPGDCFILFQSCDVSKTARRSQRQGDYYNDFAWTMVGPHHASTRLTGETLLQGTRSSRPIRRVKFQRYDDLPFSHHNFHVWSYNGAGSFSLL